MHLQLPGTLLTEIEMGASETRPAAPEKKAVVLDRLVLNRPARKVKFYFRNNRFKRCYSDLSEEQVRALVLAAQKNEKDKPINFVFDDDLYAVTSGTKRFVK